MIIGLCGLAGSGKNAVADTIWERFWFERIAFADPIRAAMYELNPIISRNLFEANIRLQDAVNKMGWDEAKRSYPEVRRLLQRYGTEVCRNQYGADFFVKALRSKLREGKSYVVTDVRFPDEVKAIHEWGGFIVWVQRPGIVPMNHVSEQLNFSEVCDAVILNDGGLIDLAMATTECVSQLWELNTETKDLL